MTINEINSFFSNTVQHGLANERTAANALAGPYIHAALAASADGTPAEYEARITMDVRSADASVACYSGGTAKARVTVSTDGDGVIENFSIPYAADGTPNFAALPEGWRHHRDDNGELLNTPVARPIYSIRSPRYRSRGLNVYLTLYSLTPDAQGVGDNTVAVDANMTATVSRVLAQRQSYR